MSDPITFPSATRAIGLPLLMVGQAQKEFFVNQALCLLDALHPRTITGSFSAPPAGSQEGDCFRVTGPASALWAGHEDCIAVLIGDSWHFVVPSEGTQVFDQAAGHLLTFRSAWESAPSPSAPAGGLIVDVQARAAIAALIQSLQQLGVLGQTPS